MKYLARNAVVLPLEPSTITQQMIAGINASSIAIKVVAISKFVLSLESLLNAFVPSQVNIFSKTSKSNNGLLNKS